jgi:hypothetical protein
MSTDESVVTSGTLLLAIRVLACGLGIMSALGQHDREHFQMRTNDLLLFNMIDGRSPINVKRNYFQGRKQVSADCAVTSNEPTSSPYLLPPALPYA